MNKRIAMDLIFGIVFMPIIIVWLIGKIAEWVIDMGIESME